VEGGGEKKEYASKEKLGQCEELFIEGGHGRKSAVRRGNWVSQADKQGYMIGTLGKKPGDRGEVVKKKKSQSIFPSVAGIQIRF